MEREEELKNSMNSIPVEVKGSFDVEGFLFASLVKFRKNKGVRNVVSVDYLLNVLLGYGSKNSEFLVPVLDLEEVKNIIKNSYRMYLIDYDREVCLKSLPFMEEEVR